PTRQTARALRGCALQLAAGRARCPERAARRYRRAVVARDDRHASIGKCVTRVTQRTAGAAYKRSVWNRALGAFMTLQLLFPALASTANERRPSWWARLIAPIVADRQRKAEAYVADYLRRHRSEQRDQFIVELERRLLGQ